MSVQCSICGTDNRDTARFCASCATSLTRTCSSCGRRNRPSAKFCAQCRKSLRRKRAVRLTNRQAHPGTGRLKASSLLAGRYIVVQRVGQGGMGAVYKATDTRLGHKVAVKEMSDAALTDQLEKQQAQEAFKQEAQMLAMLSHANLPRVTDHFSEASTLPSEGGKQYLVMDFIEGQTLEELLEQATGFLDVSKVVKWAKQLCDVLSYLHNQQPPIIFRDLKPANIMVTKNGHIKLIDFGIARLFKKGKATDTTSLGTEGYAPPEQYGKKQTDERSDIYALGATLHHLLTKHDPTQSPFKFPPLRSLNPHVPAAIEQVIMRAVEQDPAQRWQSAREMRAAWDYKSSAPLVKMLPCPKCSTPNRQGAKFCSKCGGNTRLRWTGVSVSQPSSPNPPPPPRPKQSYQLAKPIAPPPAPPPPAPSHPLASLKLSSRLSQILAPIPMLGIFDAEPVVDGKVSFVHPERLEKLPFDLGRLFVLLSIILLLLTAFLFMAGFVLALGTVLLVLSFLGLGCLLPIFLALMPMLLGPIFAALNNLLFKPVFDQIRANVIVPVLNFQVIDHLTGQAVNVILYQKSGQGQVRPGDKVQVYGVTQRSKVVRAFKLKIYESGGQATDYTVYGIKPWSAWMGLLVLTTTIAAIVYLAILMNIITIN